MKISKWIAGMTFGTFLAITPTVTLAQTDPPSIVTHPEGQSVTVGSLVAFTVEASGTEPFSYQWYFNGSEISGATESSFVISPVTLDHAGDYVAGVMNSSGTDYSVAATLIVTEASAQNFLDFNNDGKADLLWVHADGRIAGWLMDGTNYLGSILLPYRAPPGWQVAGQADMDQDGKIDFLWQHAQGLVAIWMMDGTNRLGSVTLPRRPTGGWRVAGLNDFNDDGSTDILWQHGNGSVAVWLMDGTNLVESAYLNNGKRASGGWKIAGLLDLDADGDKDILWQHGGGRLVVWYLDGMNVERTGNFQFSGKTTSSWRISGTSDLNGDGENDLIWRHSEGYLAFWLMSGTMEPTTVSLGKGKRVAPGWDLRTK